MKTKKQIKKKIKKLSKSRMVWDCYNTGTSASPVLCDSVKKITLSIDKNIEALKWVIK